MKLMNNTTEEEVNKYLFALQNNNDKFDEIELGLNIGFDEKKTNEIITKLLEDGKIEFMSFGLCSYKSKK
jgi:hypothetical protein